ncbi:MAG: tannase/feruloyl esterase family alpha/beta hydrolase [Asticcacaulis sp.]
MTRNLDALAVALMETPRRRRLPCLSAATSDVRLCFPKTLSVLAFLTLACTVSGVRAEPASTAPPLAAVTSCESLAADVPASAFSLPTNGARIDHAERIDAGGVSYCKTTGSILPVSPGAPDIRFEVDLPVSWNGKALQFGGGGYNGFIPDTTSWSSLGLRSAPPPLAQGYLTFADDSGHQAKDSNDASFAMNDESLANYAYMHIKKAKDVAFVLAVRFYGKAPRRLYFAGGSTGGREAMTAALRWPHDYDGVISNFPTATFTGLRLWGAKLAGAIYANDSAGWIAPATVDRIASAGMDDCDALDGVRDGIVSNMAACRAGAAQRLRALACPPAGTSAAADCLTDAQLKTIAVYHEGFVPSPAVVALVPSFGGYNILEGAAMNLGSDPAWHEPLLSGPNAPPRRPRRSVHEIHRHARRQLQPAHVRHRRARPLGAARGGGHRHDQCRR